MLKSVFSDLCVDYATENDTVVLRSLVKPGMTVLSVKISPIKPGMTMFEYRVVKVFTGISLPKKEDDPGVILLM